MRRIHRFRSLSAIGAALVALGATFPSYAAVFINEIHYDNVGTDTGEFIEVAGSAGASLDGWFLALYNGNGGAQYGAFTLGGTLGDSGNGFGFAFVDGATNSIQNGSPDGVALVNNLGQVVQFLSYEGSFTAVGGAADGMTSSDIGVVEGSGTPVGFSLQVTGNVSVNDAGEVTSAFVWAPPSAETKGAINTGQTFNNAGGGDGGGDPDPEPQALTIMEIQGAAHRSAFEGQQVTTSGIVTAVTGNGFYVQDAAGDGDAATSDAIFVFTGSTPSVSVGDAVDIAGAVDEFTPGGASSGNLSTTEIVSPAITILSAGNSLPAATIIGSGGRTPPTQSIDSDNFASFNPEIDGIDFYESLEGMLVTLSGAQAVAPTNRFGEIFAVADGGAAATGMNDRGGITIADGDFNPERLQIDDTLLAGNSPEVNTGDRLGDITGIVGFNFGNFELLATEAPIVTSAGLVAETTIIPVEKDRLNVATFNVENLDPTDSDAKFAELARQIVEGLRAPDIIGLQEIQDNNGAGGGGGTDASLTYQRLIDAIVAAGGPTYAFADVPPVDGTNGGEPGGNIRNGFLYNPERVDLVPGSLMLLPGSEGDPVFSNTRKPLVATFLFNGHEVTIVNNHFTSKGGSDPLFGVNQPPENGGEARRVAQAAAVNAFIDSLLALDPTANIIALGDLNEFHFLAPLLALAGEGLERVLTDLAPFLLDPEALYSFIFEGNSQLLDHILVSDALLAASALVDIVHMNAEFFASVTDHDPTLASFLLPQVPAPATLLLFLFGLAVFWRRRRAIAAA